MMVPLRQKLIYIASPYSHKDQTIMDIREEMITAIAAGLTERYGYSMFLPITQSAAMARFNPNLDGAFDAWKSIDEFTISDKADEVWVIMLDGWRESVGVQAEIVCADKHNVPVKFYDPYESRFL
jgi:hypothetical protein